MIYMQAVSDLDIYIYNKDMEHYTDIDIKKGEIICIPSKLTSYPHIEFYVSNNNKVFHSKQIKFASYDTLGYIPIDLLNLYFVRLT